MVHLHLFRCRCNRQKKQETFAPDESPTAEPRRAPSYTGFEIAVSPHFPAPKRENFLYGDSVFMKGSSQPPPPPPRQPSGTNAHGWHGFGPSFAVSFRSVFVDSEALHGCAAFRRKSLIQLLRSETIVAVAGNRGYVCANCRAKASRNRRVCPSVDAVGRTRRPAYGSAKRRAAIFAFRAQRGACESKGRVGRNTKEAIVAAAAYRRRRAAAARAAAIHRRLPCCERKLRGRY